LNGRTTTGGEIPFQGAQVASLVFGLAATALGAIAKVKTAKLRKAEAMVNVAISGVEAIGDEAAKRVAKKSVRQASVQGGVVGELAKQVKMVTGRIPFSPKLAC